MRIFRLFCHALNLLWMTLTARVVVVILAALMPLLYWYGPGWMPSRGDAKKTPTSRWVDDAAGEVARSIVEQCPKPEKSWSRLLVLPVRNDRENAIENMIRREFQQQVDLGWFTLVEKSITTQALDRLQLLTFGRDGQKELTKDDAIRIGKAADAELVLLSQVDRFVPGNRGHEIRGSAQLINIETGDVSIFPFDNVAKRSMMRNGMGLLQLAGLAIFTLIWPVLMIPVLRRVVARENNRDNITAMVVMAAIPLAVAMLMAGSLPTTAFGVVCCCVLFALAAGWTGFVMDELAEK